VHTLACVKRTQPEAIIFDCDGVLVDSEVIHIDAELEMLAELGLTYGREAYLNRFVGLSNADFHAELRSDFQNQFGREFPADFSSRLHQRVWPRIEAELQAIEGVVALVQSFKGQVAVGSSSPYDMLTMKLRITGLQGLFSPHIYSSEHVKAGKPAPDLFLYTARQIGAHPARCMVIEDSVHGIVAARAAGMIPIGFVGGGHSDRGLEERLSKSGAEVVVSHHAQIQALLA
jgi:HAD superfamily hydrolase (TIGR01509 family)